MTRIFRGFKKNILYLSLMILIPVVNIAYGLLDNSVRGYYILVTEIDRKVPYIKEFIVIYWIWYPFIILSLIFFCIYHKETYYKVLFTIIIGMIVCYIIYFFFQTTVPRPEIYGKDFFSQFVRLTYKLDKPFNCFPSIHVLTSYSVIKGAKDAFKDNIKGKTAIYITGILIILATQFVKQHVILDVIVAIILCEVIYRFIVGPVLERSFLWIKKFCLWLTMKKKLEI